MTKKVPTCIDFLAHFAKQDFKEQIEVKDILFENEENMRTNIPKMRMNGILALCSMSPC